VSERLVHTGNHVPVPRARRLTKTAQRHVAFQPGARGADPIPEQHSRLGRGRSQHPATGAGLPCRVMKSGFVTGRAGRHRRSLARISRPRATDGIVHDPGRRFLAISRTIADGKGPKAITATPTSIRRDRAAGGRTPAFIVGSALRLMANPTPPRALHCLTSSGLGSPPKVPTAFLAAMGFTSPKMERLPTASSIHWPSSSRADFGGIPRNCRRHATRLLAASTCARSAPLRRTTCAYGRPPSAPTHDPRRKSTSQEAQTQRESG